MKEEIEFRVQEEHPQHQSYNQPQPHQAQQFQQPQPEQQQYEQYPQYQQTQRTYDQSYAPEVELTRERYVNTPCFPLFTAMSSFEVFFSFSFPLQSNQKRRGTQAKRLHNSAPSVEPAANYQPLFPAICCEISYLGLGRYGFSPRLKLRVTKT